MRKRQSDLLRNNPNEHHKTLVASSYYKDNLWSVSVVFAGSFILRMLACLAIWHYEPNFS